MLEIEDYGARFDRVIFTVSNFTLPLPVFEALEIGGLIGLPVRQRGKGEGYFILRKVDEDRAVSIASRLCRFVPIFGEEGDNTGVHALQPAARELLARGPLGDVTELFSETRSGNCRRGREA